MQVVHNDFNSENILVDPHNPNRVSGIIDFGDMVRAPRIFDVAVCASYMMEGEEVPVEAIFHMLEGYAGPANLRAQEIDVLYPCIITRLAVRLVIPTWRARLFPDQADRLLHKNDLVRGLLARLNDVFQTAFTDR
ncbi:phosphotransferase [Breoghania sp.]|uniref:phosphotransferase n=1 Tax=Breoghania sp. TaxID=2065378 RepID=UPI003204C8F9